MTLSFSHTYIFLPSLFSPSKQPTFVWQPAWQPVLAPLGRIKNRPNRMYQKSAIFRQILDTYGSSRPYGYARLVTFRFESVTITKSSFLMVIRRNLLNRPVSTDKVVMVTCCFPPIRSKAWLWIIRDDKYYSRYGFDPAIALAIEGRH